MKNDLKELREHWYTIVDCVLRAENKVGDKYLLEAKKCKYDYEVNKCIENHIYAIVDEILSKTDLNKLL